MGETSKAVLTFNPLRVDFFSGDNLVLSTNARGMMKFEHLRYKKGSAEAVEGLMEELDEVEDEPDNRPEWQSVPSVKDITEGISEVRVIKYQKYEFDIPLHSLTLRKGTSFYYGWVVGPENGNVPLLYVVKMSLCTLTCKIIV